MRMFDKIMFLFFLIILSFHRQVLTDLQQKVNNLQTSMNNQRNMGTGQQAPNSGVDVTVVNEIREIVRMIKSETNSLVQKSVRRHSNS